jgi:hypothetical protein
MANSLNLRGGCGEGPVVECSYDYSTSTPRYKYVIRRATSASYVVGSGSPVTITLTDNAAVGYLSWNGAQSVTITAKGCGCDASCVIPPCCVGKDYLRISFSGFRDLSFHYERTLAPPNFGTRNIFGSWDTAITGLAGLNGTWLIPVGSGTPQPYQCYVDPLDTGVDVTFSCRWFSYGARYVSTQVITGETWNQDLVGTVTGRLWLHYDNIWIVGAPGTMVGTANKTVGESGAYNYSFNSVWTPKLNLSPFEAAGPVIVAGNGIVTSFSAHPTYGFGAVGSTSFLNFTPVICGARKFGSVFLTQYGSGSHYVNGEGFQPAYHHSNTGPVSYPGAYAAGRYEGQYISVP